MSESIELRWWSRRVRRDAALLVVVTVVATLVSHRYDLFEWFSEWSIAHESWQLDEVAVISMCLVVALALFAVRRWHEAAREGERHRDVAERLQTSEERFRQGFEAAATGIALVDIEDGRFLKVNPAGCAMLGYELDQLVDLTIQDVTHPDDLAASAERFRRVVSGEVPSSQAKLRYVRRDGSSAPVLVTTAVVRDSAGKPTHMIAHVVDMTEQEAARQRLYDLLASKDELIASVSHELRTPLAAVIGYADLLRGDHELSPGEREEMVQAIVEQGSDLANIVEDLLVAARMDMGSLVVASVPVDLRAQASQVLETIHINDESPRVELVGHACQALGDPARVRQIVRNLVTNALRYGGPNVAITIGCADSAVQLAVSDDGAGIPEDKESRVFDRYERAHSREGVTASVGLGLTISRKLARLMNGELTYSRRDGRSVFTVVLPAADGVPSDNFAASGNTRHGASS